MNTNHKRIPTMKQHTAYVFGKNVKRKEKEKKKKKRNIGHVAL